MRRINIVVVIIIFSLYCIMTIDAREPSTKFNLYGEISGYERQVSLPEKGQVLIVGKIALSPALNRDFLAASLFRADRNKPIVIVLPVNDKAVCFTEFEDFFFVLADIDGKNEATTIEYIELGEALVNPFALMEGLFRLPLNAKFRVPKGAQCVYIGSFYYTMEGYLYTIASVDVVDEYEAAVRALEERFGKGQTLVRVPLQALKE